MKHRFLCHRVGPALLSLTFIAVALPLGACQNTNPSTVINDMIEGLQPTDPSDVARDAFNVYDADKRRRAINKLSTADWGGQPPYVRTYRLLLDDPDATVRAAAVSALGRHGTANDVPRLLVRLGADSAKIVRWEASRAMQRIHDPRAIDPLITALDEDRDMDVRMASALALGQYDERRVFNALVGALNDEDFGVAHAAQQSLATLTGQDFGDRSEPWWAWAKQTDALFANQQTYYYPEYENPGFLAGRLAFWKEREGVEMKRPRTGEELAPIPEEAAGGPAAGLEPEPEAEPTMPDPDPDEQPTPEPRPEPQPEPEPAREKPAVVEPEPTPATPEPAGTEPDAPAEEESPTADQEPTATPEDEADEDEREQPRRRSPRPDDHPLGASG